MHKRTQRFIVLALTAASPLFGWNIADAQADETTGEQAAFFENSVRPILVERCYECHSIESDKSKGGLLLDSRQGWMAGGDSGTVIVPQSADESLLIKAIRYDDPDLEMPPKGRLPKHEIEVLERWVASGAFDPREGAAEAPSEEAGIDIEKGREFWSFRPIEDPPHPNVHEVNWPTAQLDRFVLAKLEEAGLAPSADADPHSLIRRLHFTLTGMPPSPAELEAFVSDPSEPNYTRIVDELLASPQFGERWGRHWLDLARYSDSTGGGRSALIPSAWRYRDYVIEAFNQDKPFDEFIRDQIAGDLLPFENDRQRNDQLTATAFLALGPKNLDLQDKEQLRMNTVDEQIDTMGRTFLGMTLSCARCHDHKFDPVSARDYYAIAGILRSTRTLVLGNVSTLVQNDLPVHEERRKAHAEFTIAKKALDAGIQAAKKAEDKERETKLQQELKILVASAPTPLPAVIGVTDQKETGDYNICVRGNVHSLGEPVKRGFLSVTQGKDATVEIPEGQSGRVQLADWIASVDNPLTARVYVNRVWSHLFGRGIVRSVDNFGLQGSTPTHPELLDHLATRFVEGGWSTKSLIRSIVVSRTWRMSTDFDSTASAIDPANDLFWRMERRRLDAESLRDGMLAIAGALELSPPGMVLPEESLNDTALKSISLDVPGLLALPLRSVYLPVFREEGRNGLFEVFDFANPSFTVGRRSTSTLPTQALYLMNSPFVLDCAERTANRLLADTEVPDTRRLDLAFHLTLSRPPTENERAEFLGYLSPGSAGDAVPHFEQTRRWSEVVQTLLACADFRFLN